MEEDKIIVSFDEAVLGEEARLLEMMSNIDDPKSDEYIKLLNRWKSMASIRTQNNKVNEDFERKLKEIEFEREKLEFEKKRFEKDLELKRDELKEEYSHKANELEMKNLEINSEKERFEKDLELKRDELKEEYSHKANELEMKNLEINSENDRISRELDLKEKELEQEKKDLRFKNIVSCVGIGVTALLGIANLATFLVGQRRDIKFSETGTYLNAYGRSHSSNASKLLNFGHKK